MSDEETTLTGVAKHWSRRKKDRAPRGVFRHRSGVWAVRFTCGAGHVHQERVGPLKSDAIRAYHARRGRIHQKLGWCPRVELDQTRAQGQQQATASLTVRQYAERWLRT